MKILSSLFAASQLQFVEQNCILCKYSSVLQNLQSSSREQLMHDMLWSGHAEAFSALSAELAGSGSQRYALPGSNVEYCR